MLYLLTLTATSSITPTTAIAPTPENIKFINNNKLKITIHIE